MKWCPAQDWVLVNTSLSEQIKGHQTDNGWKPIVWGVCEAALAEAPDGMRGGVKTAEKCQDHFTNV